MPLCCPDNSETLSGCFRNGCPDAAEIRKQIHELARDLAEYSALSELGEIQ